MQETLSLSPCDLRRVCTTRRRVRSHTVAAPFCVAGASSPTSHSHQGCTHSTSRCRAAVCALIVRQERREDRLHGCPWLSPRPFCCARLSHELSACCSQPPRQRWPWLSLAQLQQQAARWSCRSAPICHAPPGRVCRAEGAHRGGEAERDEQLQCCALCRRRLRTRRCMKQFALWRGRTWRQLPAVARSRAPRGRYLSLRRMHLRICVESAYL
mmetsp:Transcript_50071/g.108511  ORF Transcript_50071/g.108511 Transcript_50071/m.108511 type:complete len:213 (+) Transcript_50071:590-1228(+)